MASNYSTSLKIQLMGNGEDSGTWGTITNTNWNLIEQAVSGVQTITMANANYTLSNLNGVLDEARNMVLEVVGTNSAIYQVIAPLVNKLYVISNNTTGGYAITIGASTGSIITIPNGTTAQVYCDGTNFYSAQTTSAGNFLVNGNFSVTGNQVDVGNMTIGGTLSVLGAVTNSSTTTLVGAATAPTVSTSDNSTSIATTAYVKSNISGLSLGTMSTQNANSVAITGGTMSGMTSIAGGTIAGTTGTFSSNVTSAGYHKSTLSNAGVTVPANYGLQASGSFGGGLAFIDSSYGIGLYSNSGTLNFALGSNTLIASKATLDVSGNFSATSFNGSGSGLTGTASSLSIGGNAGTVTTITSAQTIAAINNQVLIGPLSTFNNASGLTIANSGSSVTGFCTQSNASSPAIMTFLRNGSFAAYFGIDTDNQFKVGGWSFGTNSYVVLTAQNYNTYSPTLTGTGASGNWAINISGTAAAATNATNATTAATVSTTVASGAVGTTQPVGTNNTTLATTAFVRSIIPAGIIMLWSGSIATIPSGWYLCNGSNGTPNLQDRFVVAAGSAYAVAATGGTADSVVVSHTHGATSTSISSSSSSVSDPGHAHSYTGPILASPGTGGGSCGGQRLTSATTYTTGAASTGIGVSTSTSTTTSTSIATAGVSGTGQNLPPYYALAYIMKG